MNDVVFVDTNILFYAHDRNAGEKRDRAAQALERLWDKQTGRLSVQVLQEFYVTVTQKLTTARASAGAASTSDTLKTEEPWPKITTGELEARP